MTDPSQERRADAQRMAELAVSARAGESRAAQRIVDRFVEQATARGIAPVPLEATQLDGRRVRTDRIGWYVNKKQTLAIGTGGEWFVLQVPTSWMSRFTGVKLQPSPPELVVARGGRDGESGDLQEFLDRVLAGR
ncbi:hypothetical protein [Propioniciclava soli]|uniref:HK97 gp10 family phage protein n=1 Tax=Propioniciclava soli TaxID=2775081 RepID=A0ABZ3C9A5_9ACTN|nr:hypothetical protein [Propioniciclava soli]